MSRARESNHSDGDGAPSAGPQPPGLPGWVKVLVAVGLILLVVLAVMLVGGGGRHGPGRHTSSGSFLAPADPAVAPRSGAAL